MNFLRLSGLLALVLLGLNVSGCSVRAAKPDLARLYQGMTDNPAQPPIILIHGLMGSTLVDAKTGKQFWPGSLSTLAFSNYRDLARMSVEDREGSGLVAGELLNSIWGVDFYSALLDSLENVGHFTRGQPGQPVGNNRRRYYVMLYDWRRENLVAVRQLHALIEQIRIDYHDPALRVDIIAHSNGGLIANYYLRYGPRDVLEQNTFEPWSEGSKRIRRIAMLDTPNLGAVTSLERLIRGFRIGLGSVPVEVLATFATPFETLPHPRVRPILDLAGKPLDLDIYDERTWSDRHWSVYSPEVEARVRASVDTPAQGNRAVAELQATFVKNLRSAQRYQLALTAPFDSRGVELAAFGGDCVLTESRAVLIDDITGPRLAFQPAEVIPPRLDEPRKPRSTIDYERLLLEPGDGLVTRASQVAQTNEIPDPPQSEFNALPIAQTFFLCAEHGHLTGNRYFQDNLLYFLLKKP